jgi:hypothetical protein
VPGRAECRPWRVLVERIVCIILYALCGVEGVVSVAEEPGRYFFLAVVVGRFFYEVHGRNV